MTSWNSSLSTAFLHAAMDGLVAFDGTGRITFVNEAARRVFGYREADLLALAVDDIMPGCLALATSGAVAPSDRGVRPTHTIEARRRGGSPLSLSIQVSVLDEAERVFGAAVRDETERKEIESALSLREDKLGAVATLVESITNDFNNTLGVILANLALAQEDLGYDHPAARRLDQIRTSSGKAANFVQQIVSEVALLPARESRNSWTARMARAKAMQELSGTAATPRVTPLVQVEQRSEPGRRLPSRAVPTPFPSAGGASAERLHVLLVDDEEPLLTAAAKILERQGCTVTACTRAADALAAVRADPTGFDLVVADYIMPGISGLDVAAEIRMLRYDVPILLVSGRLTDEVRAEAAAVGVIEVLPKPYAAATLVDVVRRLAAPSRRRFAG